MGQVAIPSPSPRGSVVVFGRGDRRTRRGERCPPVAAWFLHHHAPACQHQHSEPMTERGLWNAAGKIARGTSGKTRPKKVKKAGSGAASEE